MQMMFSICIPTYSRLQDLKICLASVFTAINLLDGDESVEVLVSDNASLDGTGEWLSRVNPSDHRIRFSAWTNSENIGAVRNVKKLLAKASGEYVFFLTDDDFVFPNAFEVVRRYIVSESPGYIQVANVIYLTKSKRSIYYGPKTDLKDKHNSTEFVQIYGYSHVFSGCVVRNSAEQIQLLDSSNNAYPSIELCATNAGGCLSISEPLIWHQWENETFWGIDVDSSSERSKKRQLDRDAQLALRHIPDGFLDAQSTYLLYEKLINTYGYVEVEIKGLFRKLGFLRVCEIRAKALIMRKFRSVVRGLSSIVRPS